jgi:hypothetical protein
MRVEGIRDCEVVRMTGDEKRGHNMRWENILDGATRGETGRTVEL